MGLLKIARTPPPVVEPGVSVMDAVSVMAGDRVGAVAVVENGKMRGIFTERDLMLRVVKEKRDPAATTVREVMTAEATTIARTCTPDEAIAVMLEGHIRHLPVLDEDGTVLALLSIRSLLHNKVDNLNREVDSLEQYMTNDSPGG